MPQFLRRCSLIRCIFLPESGASKNHWITSNILQGCKVNVQADPPGTVHAADTIDNTIGSQVPIELRDTLDNRDPMRRALLCVLALACLAGAAPKKPKLVLAIVVDQFRYDYQIGRVIPGIIATP